MRSCPQRDLIWSAAAERYPLARQTALEAMTDELREIQAWFLENCDGDWEHGDGIRLETIDNPGWSMRVSLEGTLLESVPFAMFEERYEHEREWLRCWVEEGYFHAAGGPQQLNRMLRIFLDWATRTSNVCPAAS